MSVTLSFEALTYKWDISEIVKWIEVNEAYIIDELGFPYQTDANSSLDFWNKCCDVELKDEDDVDEYFEWYEKCQDWYFRHSWFSSRSGSFLAEVLFRRVDNKIEIEWDNSELFEDVKYINPIGLYYVDVEVFSQIIHEFMEDYMNYEMN